MRARRREQGRNSDIATKSKLAAALSALLGRVLLAAALMTVCAPASVVAKAPDAVQQFASAQKLYDSGDYAAALPLFRKVLAHSGSPNARLYVARCLRELGRLPEAFEQMDTTQRDAALRAQTEPKYAQTRDASAAERAILESRIGRLIIAVANPPPDVQVTLNDQVLPAERLGSATTVNPGTMRLTIEAPGMEKIQRRVSIAAGETKTVALTLQAVDNDPPPPPPATSQPDVPQQSGGAVRTVGFVVAGLGVASLAAAGVSWFASDQKFSSAGEECGSPCSSEKLNEIKGSVNTLDTIATATLIGGVVGTVAGTAMIMFGGPSTAPTTATLSVSPGLAMIGCTGSF
jgi:hypothetical protein